ncbi:hypothetical protein RI845_04440 [Thalassotalea nanhaiensis]|uniref:Outer membrane protein beta-barrel domain-containing protein n=1 Tax=Thalassotalea nanhaiensis TaxID=3065648 RepID=A0ABY9TKZ2_9GAMM|nr:hypothetical protein RI845_04440 [Colwelliaceae bacterium SQ345]
MKNKRKLIPLLLSGIIVNICANANANASEQITNRDFIQASYEQTDYDEYLSLSGYSLLGSKKVTENIYITAEYISLSDDIDIFFDDLGVDQTEISLGAGYTYTFNEKTEIFVHLAIANIEVKSGEVLGDFFNEEPMETVKFKEDDTGYDLNIGAVYRFNESWEGSLILNHKDVIEGNTGIGGSILYHFSDWFAAGTTYLTYDDFDETNIHLRVSF